MGALLSYSIMSGLFMLALYLAYRVFLARENQHSFNRGVLLLIYLVSFSMPMFVSVVENMGTGSVTSIATEDIEIISENVVTQSKPVWGTILVWVFIVGMVTVTIKTAFTWFKLSVVIRKGKKIKQDGYTLVVTNNENYAPFSWMRYIVISRSDYENNYPAITAHELKHIVSHHWADLLIAQIVCIINWFNPAAWFMRDELMLVHEYQADMAVIDNGHNPQEYQMLLIKKAVGSRFPSLANSLNHSKLKKRITMMYKSKNGAGRKFKALALVPMLALALCVVSVPAVRATVSTLSNSSLSADKGSENSAQSKVGNPNLKVKNFNNNGNETTIVITGENLGSNLTVSGGTFTTMGKTYQAKSINLSMTDGNACYITIVFPFTSEYENSSMTLNINGKEISLDLESFFKNSKSIELAKVGVTDVRPQYPGGERAMLQAIMDEIKYAEAPKKDGASGRAVIKFIVNANGEMQDFEIMKSSGYGDLDAEAIRAIKEGLREKWVPGTVNGQPVSVSYCVPIIFALK